MTKLKRSRGVSLKDQLRHNALPKIKWLSKSLTSLDILSNPDANLISEASRVKDTVAKAMEPLGKAAKPLEVVLLTMIGGHRYLFAAETLISLILQNRGHRVRHVVCDQEFSACEVKKSRNREDWERLCGRCWSLGRHLSSSYGLDVVGVSSLVSENNSSSIESIDSIVEASLLKHFMVGNLDQSDAHFEERKKAYYASAATSLKVGEAIARWQPDRVLMSHGIYSTWGPAREFLLQRKIPVVTYGKGKKKQTIKFNWSTSADWWDVSDEWEQVKDLPLKEEELSLINDYLASRRDHSGDTMVYNFGAEESTSQTKAKLGLDPDKLTFTAFTNVLWDAASAQREIAFDNPTQWVLETIKWFAAHPERQLILKIHPAEVVIGTNQPFAGIVRQYFPELPTNVRLIEPHEKVNSWSIIKVTDLGLVHTSTVGMELPLEGVPVAVVSKTHFRDRGFTIDVNSRDEYFELLENFQPSEVQELRERAKKYAYLLFERYQLPFSYFDEPSHADVRGFKFDRLKEIAQDPLTSVFLPCFERGEGSFLMPRP